MRLVGLEQSLAKEALLHPFLLEKEMLCLSRKVNEVILIGEDIRLVVCKISKHSVLIGVDAPLSLSVDRLEVREKIALEGRRTLREEGGGEDDK